MRTTADQGDTEQLQDWLLQAFRAERAAAPCCLLVSSVMPELMPESRPDPAPAPKAVRQPAVRGSFVLMLVISIAGLLLFA
jgi:hypothetical protein